MTEINKIIAHTIFSDILIDDIKVKRVRLPTEILHEYHFNLSLKNISTIDWNFFQYPVKL